MITGEFWAQTTEGDGNFNMFRFLEREGAQVLVEPIATWIAYMIYQVRMNAVDRKRLNFKYKDAKWYEVHKHTVNGLKFRLKWLPLVAGEGMWTLFYHRVTDRLGGLTHHLIPQKELAQLAHPYYQASAWRRRSLRSR